jgi:hypothetical protein
VRPIALAQRKSDAELWVELCELVQAGKFLVSADAGAHIEGNAVLMPRGPRLTMRRRILVATMRGLPAHGPLSPSQTHACSCAVRWADVIVTCPCTSTKARKKRAAETAKGGVSLAIFLSS